MTLERLVQCRLSGRPLSAGSLFCYWFYWFIRQQQNKAMLLLIVFVLALWHYWLEQPLKIEAMLFVNSVFIWSLALLCYAQQKLWQQHLQVQHYFWLSLCTTKQRFALRLCNVLPVLATFSLVPVFFHATDAMAVITLTVAASFWPKFRLLSVALCSFILLLLLNGQGLWA